MLTRINPNATLTRTLNPNPSNPERVQHQLVRAQVLGVVLAV